jgi:hypothetical protein
MDTMTTTQQLGMAPGRARRGASAPVVCTSWREITGMPAFPMNAYAGNSTSLAGAEHLSFTKRHARHLALGST